jgi:heme oxygenase (biliverdin-IX-beta and delta-forming)
MMLKRLYDETRARHAALERRLPLLDPQLSHKSYRCLLTKFHGYYAPLEERMLALPWWEEINFNYVQRLKTPRLEQDLIALGGTTDELAKNPRCAELPELAAISQALGCLYVIEGATLGGRTITRHLQASLGLTPETGGAFFAGYGAETGPKWQAFGAMLSALAERRSGEDQIVASANQTFETVARWLFPSP